MSKVNMPLQIIIAVLIGSIVGSIFPSENLNVLSDIGKIFIHWIKLIAGPFLFFTILGAIIQVDLKWGHGLRLIGIAILNTSIALALAIAASLVFFSNTPALTNQAQEAVTVPEASLSLGGFVNTFMPDSLFTPFVKNEILFIALLALLLGIATRGHFRNEGLTRSRIVNTLEHLRSIIAIILFWLIKIIPVAVFAIIAATVSKYGFQVFASLFKFVAVVLLVFFIQVAVVYGSWIFGIAKINFKKFIQVAKTPVLYALGVNSSLATLPLTLNALKELKVSDRSASLGAGVATNLNNDGIVLYEALAIYFIAFAYNVPMDFPYMLLIALTCIVASVGITGIPEAGFISLSVIVGILGLPLEALPILLSVDWIIARFRSAVNVLSDMTLSIAMDATEKDAS